MCRDLRESGWGLGPLCVGISQYLTHGKHSVHPHMSLASVGHETETMELAFAQGTGVFLELGLLLPEMIVRWIFQRPVIKMGRGKEGINYIF